MDILIIGGTRNLGHIMVFDLLAAGHRVSVLNRGLTRDELPFDVERLRADRTDPAQLADALEGREFDMVVDTALYAGTEAETVTALLDGRVGRYVFISTGQVYLVREGAPRPAREEDYAGPVMPEPPLGSREHPDWRYGVEKRQAEDWFALAWAERSFPYTSLRLPMVHSERDHYERIANYLARLQDGGPILVPEDGGLGIRHVYAADVAQVVRALAERPEVGLGEAYNVGQDETLTLDEVLEILARELEEPLRVLRVPRETLEERRLLPECSPFSGRWMSALDNRKSREHLGVRYTPMGEYLPRLVAHWRARREREPVGYARRKEELELAVELGG